MTGPPSSSYPGQVPPPAAVISPENEEKSSGFDRNFAGFVLRRPAAIFGDPGETLPKFWQKVSYPKSSLVKEDIVLRSEPGVGVMPGSPQGSSRVLGNSGRVLSIRATSFMENRVQQASVDGIQKEHRHKLNPDKDLVVNNDGIIIQYEFNYDSSHIYSSGKIYFKDGKEREARFFKFEKSEEDLAKKIFTLTSKFVNYKGVGVLKPHFLTYYEPQNIWILCTEKFDHLLSEIKMDVEDRVDGDSWWLDSIWDLLQTIKDIHSHMLFHNGLNQTDNYVVVSDKIKIINIQSSFEDLEDPEDLSNIRVLRTNDLKAFRNMLKEKIMLPGDSWLDRDAFFDFFDYEEFTYPLFVEKLASHPFLLTPAERMKCFYSIHDSANESKFKRILDGRAFHQYRKWNRKDMVREFQEVYYHSNSKYDGESVWDLVEFLKDVYVHHNPRDLTLEAADAEVKRLYPNFLEKIHAIV
ncbi:unnamed protein product [Prunus armeniaca]|uniref:Uncharacterized protein n=1 Tax=Prunus armeniaca TaxID=36596 RepID=A0A6J5Y3C1_PRUAR|nr:unnamed protein product [Prunus armeniaca]